MGGERASWQVGGGEGRRPAILHSWAPPPSAGCSGSGDWLAGELA